MRAVEQVEQRAGECIVRVVADTAQVPMVGTPAAGFLGAGVRAALPVHGAACPPPSRSERDVQNAPLKLSQFVEGRSWCTCERGGINEPRLFAYDWLENSEEIHSFSASVDAL